MRASYNRTRMLRSEDQLGEKISKNKLLGVRYEEDQIRGFCDHTRKS